MVYRKVFLDGLRWLFSVGFFFLAMTKASLLMKYGLEPYELIIESAGLPRLFRYYGVLAVAIEFSLALCLWVEKVFRPAIVMAGLLTFIGIIISTALVVFKMESDCGCGLLGDSEYGLLAQKVAIVVGLTVLFRNKKEYFG